MSIENVGCSLSGTATIRCLKASEYWSRAEVVPPCQADVRDSEVQSTHS
jgi:hypothetical protein